MISVPQALSIVKDKIRATKQVVSLPVDASLGYILAEDVLSPINMPPFNQSAMDGYAVNGALESSYNLIGEVQAGSAYHPILNEGESIRIFTGAPVPDSATAVIMQEKVEKVSENTIVISDRPTLNKNVRLKGEQIKQGEIALKKGSTINAAIIGFLSGLGITKISVYKQPDITIIATGNELVKPGNDLNRGEIYESNAIMLKMALIENGFTQINVLHVEDDYQSTLKSIDNALDTSDFVLLTGGISVGDYDFVGRALQELNTVQHFYKVKQKPGKPLYFGSVRDTYIFALPGNPAAALTSFYIYVLNSLCRFTHLPKKVITTSAILKDSYTKKGGRAQFLKACVNKEGEAEVLTGQSSAMLRAFAFANAFVYIPEESIKVEVTDSITLYSIPHA